MDAAQETWPGLRAPEPTTRGGGPERGWQQAAGNVQQPLRARSATIRSQSETQTTTTTLSNTATTGDDSNNNRTAQPTLGFQRIPSPKSDAEQLTGVLYYQVKT